MTVPLVLSLYTFEKDLASCFLYPPVKVLLAAVLSPAPSPSKAKQIQVTDVPLHVISLAC